MKIQEDVVTSNRYWFTWGLSSALGFSILLMQLDSYNYRSICSPVIGCGYAVPLAFMLNNYYISQSM